MKKIKLFTFTENIIGHLIYDDVDLTYSFTEFPHSNLESEYVLKTQVTLQESKDIIAARERVDLSDIQVINI